VEGWSAIGHEFLWGDDDESCFVLNKFLIFEQIHKFIIGE